VGESEGSDRVEGETADKTEEQEQPTKKDSVINADDANTPSSENTKESKSQEQQGENT
jgi:hypothetical protein